MANIVQSAGGGYLFSDRTRVSSPDADLSAEPDVVYLSAETIDSGRVRLVPSASGEEDSYVELEGALDLVVEIVSDSSVAKDTKRLPISYCRAGIAEYWLVDARRERLLFRIHVRGADGYELAPVDGEGCHLSAVFDCRFRPNVGATHAAAGSSTSGRGRANVSAAGGKWRARDKKANHRRPRSGPTENFESYTMDVQAVTVTLPEPLYERLARRAKKSRRVSDVNPRGMAIP